MTRATIYLIYILGVILAGITIYSRMNDKDLNSLRSRTQQLEKTLDEDTEISR